MEILQNLLESEILTEETMKELETAIQTQISEAVEAAVTEARVEAETNVRAELAEQFVTDKEALVEALDTKAQQFLEAEMLEFKDDVENFRDLEAEHAEKIVAIKKQLSEVAKKDFSQLVNILNEFLEERVTAEFDELKEDIAEVKKIKFGQSIFESIKDTFEREYFDKDEIDREAEQTAAELNATKEELNEARKELAGVVREQTLTEALSSLDGRPREVMAAILDKTPTDRIQKVYEQFIGRVLNESVVEENTEEKESEVLAEDDSNTQSNEEEVVTETVTVTGDAGTDLVEEDDERNLSEQDTTRLRDLSGQLD
jgi:hypothetical protein